MKHSITINCECEALPRIMEFLSSQTGKPDDNYAWSELVEDNLGITWGFDEESLRDKNYFVACYNKEHHRNLKSAIASGAIYCCSTTLDGNSQAYDAGCIAGMINECADSRVALIFGMKGKYVWQSSM